MIVRAAIPAMGTRFELVLSDGPEAFLRAAAEEAAACIEEWDRRLSRFRRDSEISRINRSAGLGPVRIAGDLMELLAECRALHRATAGTFDPTIGPLMDALGFHDDGRTDIKGARALVGMDRVELDPDLGLVRLPDKGMRLDLGAVGKGHALDEAAGILRNLGVTCGLIHGGTSTVVAIGTPRGQDGWRIALEHGPDAPVAVLQDLALSVSAPHGRQTERGGRSIGHVLDPRTGRSSDAVALAATAGPSAREADAWSTALVVLGRLSDDASVGALIRADESRAWQAAGPYAHVFRFQTSQEGPE